ncbi:hypothetical protein D3C79_1116930 [compost metagenome]
MADSGARWHHAEAAEGLLAPFQEHIALMVTLHFQAHVLFERILIAKVIHGY